MFSPSFFPAFFSRTFLSCFFPVLIFRTITGKKYSKKNTGKGTGTSHVTSGDVTSGYVTDITSGNFWSLPVKHAQWLDPLDPLQILSIIFSRMNCKHEFLKFR
jgi:hypothetical protein